jgi:hypothetical protein
MKFFYIVNKTNKLVEFGKISSDRFLLLELISTNIFVFILLKLKSFSIDINILEKEIINLLIERNSNPPDIPEYKSNFSEDEIFEIKQFMGKEIKLCNSGFDNKIIFLINIYNSLLKDESPLFLLFTNNHSEFTEWMLENRQC